LPVSVNLAQFLGSKRCRDFSQEFSCACHFVFSDNSRFAIAEDGPVCGFKCCDAEVSALDLIIFG
jgi:hypothetical protein